MGTRFEFVLVGNGETHLRAAGEEALAEIRGEESRWSLFARDSLTSLWNREAFNREIPLDEDALEFLLACQGLHRVTQGAFDPSIGRRMTELGFRSPPSGQRDSGDSLPGFDAVEIDAGRGTLRFLDGRVSFDFGAVGKGQALDRAARILEELGVGRALLHGGTSTVVGLGAPPKQGGWSIAVEDGLGGSESSSSIASERSPVAVLRDASLSVSAPRGRRTGDASHLIDPRTGDSVLEERTAAILSDSARASDAWSTALCVAPGLLDSLPEDMSGLVTRGPSPTGSTSTGWRIRRSPGHVVQVPDCPRSPSPEVRTA